MRQLGGELIIALALLVSPALSAQTTPGVDGTISYSNIGNNGCQFDMTVTNSSNSTVNGGEIDVVFDEPRVTNNKCGG